MSLCIYLSLSLRVCVVLWHTFCARIDRARSCFPAAGEPNILNVAHRMWWSACMRRYKSRLFRNSASVYFVQDFFFFISSLRLFCRFPFFFLFISSTMKWMADISGWVQDGAADGDSYRKTNNNKNFCKDVSKHVCCCYMQCAVGVRQLDYNLKPLFVCHTATVPFPLSNRTRENKKSFGRSVGRFEGRYFFVNERDFVWFIGVIPRTGGSLCIVVSYPCTTRIPYTSIRRIYLIHLRLYGWGERERARAI